MKLMTKAIEKSFEKQGDTSEMESKDIKIIVKYFNPSGIGTWYVYDREPDNHDILWCFANLNDSENAECGTVSLQELEDLRVPPFGASIERDLYFEKHTLKEVIDIIKSGKNI
jgi:hypothetical protein